MSCADPNEQEHESQLEQEPHQKQKLPIEGSWRMVEGENDSFDTSIIPDFDYDEEIPPSTAPSHLSSQGHLSSIGSSQESSHSIQDFVTRAYDERVILRSPFRPSVPSTRQTSFEKHRTPDLEFHMPSMYIENPGRGSSGRSSRTIRPLEVKAQQKGLQKRPLEQASPKKKQATAASSGNTSVSDRVSAGFFIQPLDDKAQQKGLRRRLLQKASPRKKQGAAASSGNNDDGGRRSISERVSAALPEALVGVLAWCLDIIGIVFKMLKYPLAIGLAVYLLFVGLIILHTMVTKSLYASLSPLCRIPGVQYLDLPFCVRFPEEHIPVRPLEFDGLMKVQSSFEQVLERTAGSISLPVEMKRSESSLRDLRAIVRSSELPHKDELGLEFNQYIEISQRIVSDLQKFNSRVGSAVDSVITMTHWTSDCLNDLAATEASFISRLASWLPFPFQPATSPFDERAVLKTYIEHADFISDHIQSLIIQAQAVLQLLDNAEDILSVMNEVVDRSHQKVKFKHDDVLWSIWSLVGANRRSLRSLSSQLELLKNIGMQRSQARAQVSALVVDLKNIQASLDDLRDRVVQPGLDHGMVEAGVQNHGNIPLGVHIDTINRGVERLEDARSRLKWVADANLRAAHARDGVAAHKPLIEDKRAAAQVAFL